MKRYDVIWIGTGQATGTVLPRLVKAGKTVALAELVPWILDDLKPLG